MMLGHWIATGEGNDTHNLLETNTNSEEIKDLNLSAIPYYSGRKH